MGCYRGSLVREETDAGAELVREFDKDRPVAAAFWVKASDEEQRYLYIASERIDDTNVGLAYREVLRLTGELDSPYLDPFRVKVISATDPLARAAMEIHRRFPGSMPTCFGGRSFGGICVDDVYIYAPSLPAAVH